MQEIMHSNYGSTVLKKNVRLYFFLLEIVSRKKLTIQVVCTLVYSEKEKKKNEEHGCLQKFAEVSLQI